jgi:murein DD-endopeptidase MepM/ murein hydrolase activator NlpD
MRPEAPLFHLSLNDETCLRVDLSVANPDLKFIDSQEKLGSYIQQCLQKKNKLFGIGGYGENRGVYNRFEHFNNLTIPRSVHLGIDLWAGLATPVFCPIKAKVHSFKFNDKPGDYGSTIILEHQQDGSIFYSLYGHLALSDLAGLKKGQEIHAGERFCSLGNYSENGGWPPHLHFQLIKDLEGNMGDYPGVAQRHQAKAYLANCPNPQSFFYAKG